MADPETREAYEERFAANQRVSGQFIDTRTHFPCPFCAAPDWFAPRIIELETKGQGEHICSECGRGARFVFDRDGANVTIRMVQTRGDDPPEYLRGMISRDESTAPIIGGVTGLLPKEPKR